MVEEVRAETEPCHPSKDGTEVAFQEEALPNEEQQFRIVKKLRKVVLLPYIIGIVWTCLHTKFSILTGEQKCRGWFIDENSLDGNHVGHTNHQVPQYLSSSMPIQRLQIASLCDNFDKSTKNLSCYQHPQFDLLTITPISSSVEPVEEAIVLVVPLPKKGDWSSSTFHFKFVLLLRHFANPSETPWLAKTIHVVSPSPSKSESNAPSLEETVRNFLKAHSGTAWLDQDGIDGEYQQSNLQLSPHQSAAILRNLLVVDVTIVPNEYRHLARSQPNRMESRPYVDLALLPNGRNGALPNMDLVFAATKAYSRTTAMQTQSYPRSTMLAHPYVNEYKNIREYLGTAPFNATRQWTSDSQLNKQISQWADDMVNLAFFAYTMAMGPYPPHSPALEYGIDSMTLKPTFHGTDFSRPPVEEFLEYLEMLVRSLSNLHERLHHSETLYLLPTPKMFVSHMEYFLPCVLLLIPLLIRSLHLIRQNLGEGVHLGTIGCWIGLSTICPMLVATAIPSSQMTIMLTIILYGSIILCVFHLRNNADRTNTAANDIRMISTLHLCACVLAIYAHTPIAFGHIAVAYPSALLWTPILVAGPVPSGVDDLRGMRGWMCAIFWLTMTALTIPDQWWWWWNLAPSFYRNFVLMPLHFNVFTLLTGTMISKLAKR